MKLPRTNKQAARMTDHMLWIAVDDSYIYNRGIIWSCMNEFMSEGGDVHAMPRFGWSALYSIQFNTITAK